MSSQEEMNKASMNELECFFLGRSAIPDGQISDAKERVKALEKFIGVEQATDDRSVLDCIKNLQAVCHRIRKMDKRIFYPSLFKDLDNESEQENHVLVSLYYPFGVDEVENESDQVGCALSKMEYELMNISKNDDVVKKMSIIQRLEQVEVAMDAIEERWEKLDEKLYHPCTIIIDFQGEYKEMKYPLSHMEGAFAIMHEDVKHMSFIQRLEKMEHLMPLEELEHFFLGEGSSSSSADHTPDGFKRRVLMLEKTIGVEKPNDEGSCSATSLPVRINNLKSIQERIVLLDKKINPPDKTTLDGIEYGIYYHLWDSTHESWQGKVSRALTKMENEVGIPENDVKNMSIVQRVEKIAWAVIGLIIRPEEVETFFA